MSKVVLFFLVYFQLAAVRAQDSSSPNEFSLHGKIAGQSEGYVYLGYRHQNGKYFKDSCALQQGAFAFKGYVDEPTEAYFWEEAKPAGTQGHVVVTLFLEPGSMNAAFQADSLSSGIITGSKTQNEYAVLDRNLASVDSAWDRAKEDYREAKAKGESEKGKELLKEIAHYHDAHYKVYYDFINSHPDSYVSASLLDMLRGGHLTLDSVQVFYRRLSPRLQQSHDGLAIAAYIRKSEGVVVGKMAPDFVQQDVNGNFVSLMDFKGNYILLDFWASWCVPCRQEFPYLRKAYNAYKGRGFTIIGVSLDTDGEKWRKAIGQGRLYWTQLSDLKGGQNAVAVKYGVQPIPDNFLIDPHGKIIARALRGEDMIKTLDGIFKKNYRNE